MAFEPIKINIPDKVKFLQVAKIVDQENFCAEVKAYRARKKLIIIPRKEFKKLKKTSLLAFSPINLDPNIVRHLKKPEYGKSIWSTEKKLLIKLSVTHNFVKEMVTKYHFPRTHHLLLAFSALCNEVWSEDLDTSVTIHSGEQLHMGNPFRFGKIPKDLALYIDWVLNRAFDNSVRVEDGAGAIKVYPSTTLEEVKDAYKRLKKLLRVPDTVSNIERDRDWYWRNKNGLGYIRLHKQITDEGERISQSGMIKAIKAYKKCLRVETLPPDKFRGIFNRV